MCKQKERDKPLLLLGDILAQLFLSLTKLIFVLVVVLIVLLVVVLVIFVLLVVLVVIVLLIVVLVVVVLLVVLLIIFSHFSSLLTLIIVFRAGQSIYGNFLNFVCGYHLVSNLQLTWIGVK